jgi:DNA-binding MarR family transcriptional regulator
MEIKIRVMKKPASQQVSALENHTGFSLRFVSNQVSHSFARKLSKTGVTVAEWVMLREMFETNSTSPSVLADATGLTRGAVSKLIDRLLAKHFVTRTEATNDRRYQDVGLTAAGRALVPKLAAIADQNDEEFFSRLPFDERGQLVSTLKKLVALNNLKETPTK